MPTCPQRWNIPSGMGKAPRSINSKKANMKMNFNLGIIFWIIAEVWTLFHIALVWNALTHAFNWLATF